ncbi:hypothetical protein ABZ759_17515 [Streptomyces sp. NPDC047860]|uniref:hypothetical protein n=1 Tax=Streptomyces sp. NPDC047860 TaxID=3155743 RepID=UPI0033E26C0C
MSVRRGTAAWILALVAAAGCTSGNGTGGSAAPPARPTATERPATERPPVVVTVPELWDGEVLAGRRGPARGDGGFSYRAGAAGKALAVAVNCQGSGTVDVALPAMVAGFRFECGADEPTLSRNELAVEAARKPGTVKVTAPSTATWAVTVSRGDPTEEDPLTAD